MLKKIWLGTTLCVAVGGVDGIAETAHHSSHHSEIQMTRSMPYKRKRRRSNIRKRSPKQIKHRLKWFKAETIRQN